MGTAHADESLERLATAIARRGLTTPARIALDAIAPLDVIAGQMALFARPFMPHGHWAAYMDALCDARGWARLRDILNRDC